ncbi:uncharacterized protein EV420DRAFT_1074561 [Desarmillaria tabescens]|uniref:F-box domain-containing protein n=1 Tax=Armillaria tabescens TaxID=1929756 RepID=A0AA39MR32_ARMTA|nr:uncharacterized protein EV420DRAFT_1074561 [Desarmillaria tabescens]KAK0442715.1 hypothetical protein EV420DRAFT_1074561 [Desarmillaria tabescens]
MCAALLYSLPPHRTLPYCTSCWVFQESYSYLVTASLRYDGIPMAAIAQYVPPELLREFFVYAFDGHSEHESLDVSRGPWTISYTCSSWRAVINSLCPEVWTEIRIHDPVYQPSYETRLRTILERSQDQPLRVSFISSKNDAISTSLFHALMRHAKRWQTAVLRIDGPYLLKILAEYDDGFPILAEILLDAQISPMCINAFRNASSLRSVTLERLPMTFSIPFPTSRAVNFRDTCVRRDQIWNSRYLDIIRHSPYLRTFDVVHWGGSPSQDLVTNTSLCVLSVSDGGFLRALSLPNLETLNLRPKIKDYPMQCCPFIVSGVRDLFMHSHCSLTHLSIINADISTEPNGDVFLEALSLVPTLVAFRLSFNPWRANTDVALEVLVQRMMDTAFLPSLQNFSVEIDDITGVQYVGFVDQQFIAMVVARTTREGKLVVSVKAKHPKGGVFIALGEEDRLKEYKAVALEVFRGEDRLI